ncbi:flavodoxin family protein [Roseobacter sp. HKCCA0434]|uniref:flavodoxin family protein n=1 Tax=Roseobacter sp. HKCCA0434 TaxID=3079297 RepID=UPI002905A598|nr:flavodoxin family protein [Roseobacter sp. HKCCA0434]
MAKIAIVYHSGYGHTEKQMEAVAEGARGAGGEVTVLKATDLHDPESGPWDVLEAADAIIFGSPVYMGSVSGPFEMFADASSKAWFDRKWQDKLASGFVNSSNLDGDRGQAIHRMITLAMQHGMLWVGSGLPPQDPAYPGDDPDNLNRLGFFAGGGSQSDADKGPDVVPRASDLANARHLGKRVVEQAERLK